MDNIKIIFGRSTQHITVRVFIMKEYLDLLIEEKWRNKYEFATFIAAIEKLPSPKERSFHSTRATNLSTCIRPSLTRTMTSG